MSKNSPSSSLNNASPNQVLPSCIRTRPDSTRRNRTFSVSFPEEECNLITGFLEPANPWEYAENVNHEDLISSYLASCEKHGTTPLPVVVDQLKKLDVEASRCDCLNLKGAPLAGLACEALEEVLKRVQFKNINLEMTALDDEGSVALFDMIEYYESATHLNISGNRDIAGRGWHACSRMIKKTRCLELLEARNVCLNEQYMPILSRALKLGTQLQILKLENCGLSGRPIIILAAALKLNTGLRELYLADNNLNVSDAVLLGAVLRSNQTLQLLDVSNNQIQDAGVGHILDGLVEQNPHGAGNLSNGLCILILWNNHLSRNAAKHLARALSRSTSLEILNVGHNVLTNECLHVMKDSLQHNRSLLRLGMQSTHITCEGAVALAECIAANPVIQRIDLRDNNLQVAGLLALSLSLKVNRNVNQLDIDDMPKKKLESGDVLKQYLNLVSEIRGYCLRNEQADFSEDEPSTPSDNDSVSERTLRVPSSMASRKISLTCETLMRVVTDPESGNSQQYLEPRRVPGGRLRSPAPSPVPSPISSPIPSPSRTRFQVSRVSESHSVGSPSSLSSSPFMSSPSISPSPTRFFASPTTSRFRVTLVEPSATPVPPPIVSSPSGNNVTVGFTFKLNDKSISPRFSPEISNTCSTAMSDIITPSGVSKLSESLATVDVSEGCDVVNKDSLPASKGVIVTEVGEEVPNSLSASLSSLDESAADLEVRQILDRHDNRLTSEPTNEKVSFEIKNERLELSKDDVDYVKIELSQSPHVQIPVQESLPVIRTCGNSSTKIQELERSVKELLPPLDIPLTKLESGENNFIPRDAASSSNVSKNSKCVNPRQRKISWIAPVNPVSNDQKAPSSLEKLLGLFQHPASFFSKAQPQYKATTVIINQQPVANSNASFLLTAGPLAGAALEARMRGVDVPSPDPLDEDSGDRPASDVLNNNKSDLGGHVSSSSTSSDASCESNCSLTSSSASCNSKNSQLLSEAGRSMCSQCTVGERECVRTRTEDENFNISKHSSPSEIGSGTGDKLWCATLSSVCGANVVMSWAHSSSPSDPKNCSGKPATTHGLCVSGMSLDESSLVSKKETETEQESGCATRLYSNVLRGGPPSNGVNMPLSSSTLWSPSREKKDTSVSLMPVSSVRLVGGGDPSAEHNSEAVASLHARADGDEEDMTQLLIAASIGQEKTEQSVARSVYLE